MRKNKLLGNFNFQKDDKTKMIDECMKKKFIFITVYYVQNIINSAGIITNIICILTFYSILNKNKNIINNNVFRYLLLKSLISAIWFIIDLFSLIWYCENCTIRNSYFMQLWFIYLYYTVEDSIFLLVGLIDILAAFDCLITIRNKLNSFRTVKFFYILTSILLIFTFALETFNSMSFQITKSITITNKTNVKISQTYKVVQKKKYSNHILLVQSFFKDFLVIILLFLFNLLIYYTIRRIARIRKRNQPNSMLVENGINAEKNISKLILYSFLNSLLGHLLSITLSIMVNFQYKDYFCLENFNWLLNSLSLVMPIFIYYFFNKLFKKYIFIKRLKPSIAP